MDLPCKHCDKADDRKELLKCDKPCTLAKDYVRCESKLIDMIMGSLGKGGADAAGY